MTKKTGTDKPCYRFKACLTIFRSLAVLLLFSNFSISAQATDIENQAISLSKMPEFASIRETESIELLNVSKDKQSLLANGGFLPKITAKKWSNGKYSIEGAGSYGSSMPCVSYEYHVDLRSKTYTLSPVASYDLDDSYLKLQTMDSKINSKALKSASDAGFDTKILDATDDSCQQRLADYDKSISMSRSVSPGVWDNTVSLRTRDLPNWTITKTTDRLKWIVYSGGTVDWLYWYVAWYAVNPSPINTHWYINYNTHWGPYFGAGSINVSKNVYGIYENYDWGWDDESTNVSQHVKIQGNNNATYTYSWNHSDWGEDSLAIWGVITLN